MITHTTKRQTTSGRLALGTTLSVLGAAAGRISYATVAAPHNVPLPPAIEVEQRILDRRAGRLNDYVAGTGRPLVLIHSINAAASAYEVP